MVSWINNLESCNYSGFLLLQVKSMMDAIELRENLKLQISHILGCICTLVGRLSLIDGAGKHKNATYSSGKRVSEEVYHLF